MMYLSRLKISLVVYCLTIVSLIKLYAQDFNYAIDSTKNVIYPFGYARETKLCNLRTIVAFNVPFSTVLDPKFFFKTYTIGFNPNVKIIFGKGNWKMATGVSIGLVKQVDNDVYSSISLYNGASVSEGYYTKKWFSAAYINCNISDIRKQKYSDKETATLKQSYPQSYQIQHLNTWIYYPTSFSSGINFGYSFKARFDIVASIGLLSLARGYIIASAYSVLAGGYSVYDNPNAGSYKLSYAIHDIRLTIYYHFGKIIEKPTK